jgi:hypothetical protein
MTDIIEAIDSYTADFLSDYTLKNWGFCELMKKSAGEGNVEQPIPVTIPGRKQVSLLDNYQVVTWIRQTATVSFEDAPDWSFGRKEARNAKMPLRIVFANKTTISNPERLVYEYLTDFPSKLSVADYQFVHVDGDPTIDPDHESIYREELGNTVYEKHRFNWNVYAINVNIQFIICEGDYRYTEDGQFRVLE